MNKLTTNANHEGKITSVFIWSFVIFRIDNLQEDNWPINHVGTVMPVIVNNECYCYSTELRILSIGTRNRKQARTRCLST